MRKSVAASPNALVEPVLGGMHLCRVPLSVADCHPGATNVFEEYAVLVPGKVFVKQKITVLFQISGRDRGKVDHPIVLRVYKFEFKLSAFLRRINSLGELQGCLVQQQVKLAVDLYLFLTQKGKQSTRFCRAPRRIGRHSRCDVRRSREAPGDWTMRPEEIAHQ